MFWGLVANGEGGLDKAKPFIWAILIHFVAFWASAKMVERFEAEEKAKKDDDKVV